MNLQTRKITWISMFVALGVALGMALSQIPNIELVTATIFISGFLLGMKEGFAVGFLTESLYSLLNPYGMAAPPLFAAQILSMGLTGLVGGWFGLKKYDKIPFFMVRCGLAGFFCTLLFAVLTTLSFVWLNHFSLKQLNASILFGFWFYMAHLLSNTIIFLIPVPVLIRILKTQWSR